MTYEGAMRGLVWPLASGAISLRVCDATPGSDRSVRCYQPTHLLCYVRYRCSACLCDVWYWHAMSGTDIAYGAMGCPVLTKRMAM
eukprot:793330-Rhodomonas_salina.1